jgi:intracellular septation protein
MKKILKPACEYGPLILFFATYKIYGLIIATATLVVATLIAVSITYLVMKKIPLMPLIAAAIVAFFGGLTVFSGNEIFIKIKPTLVNIVFAGILFAGLLKGKGLLKHMFESAMQMTDTAWKTFSLRWAIFFLFMAALNEIVWRNFSTDTWVQFKVFGLMGATLLFFMSQIPFLQKNIIEENKGDENKL